MTVGLACSASDVVNIAVTISPDFARAVLALFDRTDTPVNTASVLSTVNVAPDVGAAVTMFPAVSVPTESETVEAPFPAATV